MERPRRNPKRKVSETADENTNADTEASNELASDLLEKACSPLTPHEIEEWQGWIELESEPVCVPTCTICSFFFIFCFLEANFTA